MTAPLQFREVGFAYAARDGRPGFAIRDLSFSVGAGSAGGVAAGMMVWAGGRYALDLRAPYLVGLLAATVGYVGVALLEARRH